MSIFDYNGCSKAVQKRLRLLDASEADQGVLQLEVGQDKFQYGPDEKDQGQILDFEGLTRVWQVVRVLVHKQYRKLTDGTLSTSSYTVTGYELEVVVVEDPFPDEMTEAGTSRALVATTSAERTAMEESTLGLARPGAYGIRKDGAYSQIERLYWARVEDEKRTKQDVRNNPRRRSIGKTVLMVQYRYEAEVSAARLLDAVNTWTLAEHEATYTLIEGSLQDHLAVSKVMLEGGELPAELAAEIEREQQQDSQQSTALVSSSNPDFLRSVSQKHQRNANSAQVLRFAMQRNLTELHNRLAAQMNTLNGALKKFRLQVEKVERLIVTLEIYLGVHENLIQFAQGDAAPSDAPITLRQLVLYADEEFGDPKNGGLSFNELASFDAWLVDSGYYLTLAPEQRCVVAIKPRRYPRKNKEGDLMPGMKDEQGKDLDSYTYFLIRNGGNLYRIQTRNIELADTLFPRRADFQRLLDRMGEVQALEQAVLDGENKEWQLEKLRASVEVDLHGYQKSVLLLQGLIFRSDVLHPLPPGLNLMKPETYGGMLQFIYDAEDLLPSGRLSFDEWQDEMNARIQKGSRVLVAIGSTSKGEYISPKDYKSRYTLANLSNEHNIPPLPPLGIYQVDTYDELYHEPINDDIPWAQATEREKDSWRRDNSKWDHDKEETVLTAPEPATIERHRYEKGRYQYTKCYRQHLVIRYNPGDAVYGGWGSNEGPHGRKNAVGFRIDLQRDEFLFHYDELTLEDIQFYLTSRVERVHYARIMPFLYKLRDRLQKEREWEMQFAQLLAQRLRDELGSAVPASVDVYALTQEAIKWYKLDKVKLKRSLTDRDAQALRMVEQRVRFYLRDRHKLTAIDSAADYRKKTLIWHHADTKRSFVATGLLKKEFVQACFEFIQTALPWRYNEVSRGKKLAVTLSRIEREMEDTPLESAATLAKATPGKIAELLS